jgi:hypothetical protein
MRRTLIATAIFGAILVAALSVHGQDGPEKLIPRHVREVWTGGTPEDALAAAKAGATIPLSTYSFSPTKVKQKRALTGTIVGTSPFAATLSGATINAVVVPLIFNIGGTIFDPTAPNNCGVEAGVSAVNRFNASPLVQPVPNLTFNGVNVGNLQYADGFMRAEFWSTIGGNPAYTNPIIYSTAGSITIVTGTNGIITESGCGARGIVSESFLIGQLASQLQALTKSGVISTTKAVFFLTSNIVLSPTTPPTPPTPANCCILGYHTAIGSPPQFYTVMDYDTSGNPARDITVPSHEIAEFMNDPLNTNATPPWGGIGSVAAGSCQGNFEVGDPVVGIQTAITMNGYTYHPQELAFFSWFFNAPATASVGAGGLFSSNGTFRGPSMDCPPGGTY